MAQKKLKAESLPEGTVLGGRGLVDEVLTMSNVASAYPLSKDNILVFAPGLFAGTNIVTSGGISAGAKSPLKGGIKEANVGGTAAHKLGRLGIQGIVVEGKREQRQILVVTKNGISFDTADGIIGLTNYSACEKLRERYGSKVGIIITGPVGEMKLANSTVAVTDTNGYPSRHAARGGLGAVWAVSHIGA